MTRAELTEKLTTCDGYKPLEEAGYKFKADRGRFLPETLEPLPGCKAEGFCKMENGKDGYRDKWGGTWEAPS